MKPTTILACLLCYFSFSHYSPSRCLADQVRPARPNVILIMTDDQGYGDLSCHGNPVLKTPHLDRLYSESVRFTDFHVSPFCTPTRAALMTGRYPARTGAYRTSSGRTMMHPNEKTIANVFATNGYTTGMVGKWHLGEAAPHRPQDRGFQHAVWHRCGGVGQAADYWGNDYFDDTYEVVAPGKTTRFQKFPGYCTDVWFSEATRFIEEHQERPFFLYLAPNAPHGPYRVADKWKQPYENLDQWNKAAEFYGMIANIDHNVGELRKRLRELDLEENTILIFMTDNGTANGAKFDGLTSLAMKGFNAHMRGKKSSVYEGGHRVPFFIHWPAGKLEVGRDIPSLTAHLDVLPTLAELCGITSPTPQLDGKSVAKLLQDPTAKPERDHLVVQFQGGPYFRGQPEPWEFSCVLKDRWRLINGGELYDLDSDPGQSQDVAKRHPEIVDQLKQHYMPFWNSVSPKMTPVDTDLGSDAQNPTTLSSQDWYMPTGNPPWNFSAISKLPSVTGPWNVNVRRSGRYRLTLRQWPREANKPIQAEEVEVRIAGQSKKATVPAQATGVDIELDLPKGHTQIQTRFFANDKPLGGAYFIDVERLTTANDTSSLRRELRKSMEIAMDKFPSDDRRPDWTYALKRQSILGSNTGPPGVGSTKPDPNCPTSWGRCGRDSPIPVQTSATLILGL